MRKFFVYVLAWNGVFSAITMADEKGKKGTPGIEFAHEADPQPGSVRRPFLNSPQKPSLKNLLTCFASISGATDDEETAAEIEKLLLRALDKKTNSINQFADMLEKSREGFIPDKGETQSARQMDKWRQSILDSYLAELNACPNTNSPAVEKALLDSKGEIRKTTKKQ